MPPELLRVSLLELARSIVSTQDMSTSFKGFQITVRVLLRAHLLDSIIRTSTVFTYMRCGTRLLRTKL